MSTRGQSFAISKKRRAGTIALIATLLGAVLGLAQTTCIVTDEIEFEDAIDYPPEVLAKTPSNQLLTVCLDSSVQEETKTFTVKVWEPDKETKDESELEAGAIIFRNMFSGNQEPEFNNCTENEMTSDSATMETGIVIKIECTVTIPLFWFYEYPLIPITVLISDKGFNGSDPKVGAHTAEVVWVLKAEEC